MNYYHRVRWEAAMYPTDLLEAIAEWQNGWGEDAARRITITNRLRDAIRDAELSEAYRRVDEVCFRKRFLVPNNPQNGGDLKPLILDGRINEGVASWTTDLSYAKTFKELTRLNNISCVFAHTPTPEEVVLNLKALWDDPDFVNAVKSYVDSRGRYAAALDYFKARQYEVVLDAPLVLEEVEAFCDRISPFGHLCETAELTTAAQQEHFWSLMRQADVYPGDARWLDREKSQRVLERIRSRFVQPLTEG
jgi:hypothetical protein